MAVVRDNPYGNFNFLVSLGDDGDPGSVAAGFAEVAGIGIEVDYVEYRTGNERVNTPRRLPGIHRFPDLVLRRGLIGSTELLSWVQRVASGTPEPRTVVVTLLDEARQPVATWKLRRAQPRKWSGPTLAAKGGPEVAMEELVLVYEGLEMA